MWGIIIFEQCEHLAKFFGLSARWLRRLPCLPFDIWCLGTAIFVITCLLSDKLRYIGTSPKGFGPIPSLKDSGYCSS